MKELLIAYSTQVLFTIGMIAIGGLLIALCNRLFYANFGSEAKLVCYITGAIGVPVHELSHALFCVIFAHKITEIKLFQISDEDGTLGYVKHTYNRKNIYQNIGNFFIGVAPIIVMSALLFLLAWAMMPDTVHSIIVQIKSLNLTGKPVDAFITFFKAFGDYFSAISDYKWWLFIIIGSFFALHMCLSIADIKNALSGLIFLLVAILIVDIILRIVSIAILNMVTRTILTGGVFLTVFLSLALLINIVLINVSMIYRLAKKKIANKTH